ncbi:MAG: M1 family metallopeptidase [Pirellulaceae bacterium]
MTKWIRNLALAGMLLSMGLPGLMAQIEAPPAEPTPEGKFNQVDKFRQLEEILPTPNDYRTASGAPGRDYWQQNVDYVIDVELNDADQTIKGKEKITYRNQSPDPLKYLWLQLDANIHSPDSDSKTTASGGSRFGMSIGSIKRQNDTSNFDGSFKIDSVRDGATSKDLRFTIVKTMMRVDLPNELNAGEQYTFEVEWHYQVNDTRVAGGRSGCEFFEKDENFIYEIAQWYPRACAYTDVNGWQHKQFLGRGEFTLEFGNYDVRIKVPDDHVVGASGELQNPSDVLSEKQLERWTAAQTSDEPMFIVTPDEAKENETEKSDGKKTWIFRAENVRDFAFATSRKFIWDAMAVKLDDKTVMAMSYYPNEGEPLWSKYSTHSVAHTLEVYSRFTFDYPYPVAISVNGPVGGMEYPMICFNGPRPEPDGTYSDRTKYGLISVVIHEVGHNWFPMIVNSDERQWTWMDEGLNTFLQVLAEAEWEDRYPSRRGDPRSITSFMSSYDQVPIMTNSESLHQFGSNAYAKPAAALTILRETILGRELFDFAFKEYANRWKFKRPMPADFFRTMEDASGVDLDWFWRGWFYTNEHVDIAVENVKRLNLDTGNPYIEKPKQQLQQSEDPEPLLTQRNKEMEKRVDRFPGLRDFYNEYDPLTITDADREAFEKLMESLSEEDKEIMNNLPSVCMVDFRNVGGLVMPLIVQLEFEDGTTEDHYLPAEIWRQNNETVTKMFVTEKPVAKVWLDPRFETADADMANNLYPKQIGIESMDFRTSGGGFFGRRGGGGGGNPMREALREKQRKNRKDSNAESSEVEESEDDGGGE